MNQGGGYTNPKASFDSLLPTPYSTKVLWSTQMKSAVSFAVMVHYLPV